MAPKPNGSNKETSLQVSQSRAISQAKKWTSITGRETWWYPSWIMLSVQNRKRTPSLPAWYQHMMRWCLKISFRESMTTSQNRSVYRTEKSTISFLSSIVVVAWEMILECKMPKMRYACSFNLFQPTLVSRLSALGLNSARWKTREPKKKLFSITIRQNKKH